LKKVELRIDDGPWLPVRLERTTGTPYAWSFWHWDWRGARQGEHTLVSRATDADGRVQPAASDPAIKLKRTYWEANQQYPRKIKI
jgi:hypothetical protein